MITQISGDSIYGRPSPGDMLICTANTGLVAKMVDPLNPISYCGTAEFGAHPDSSLDIHLEDMLIVITFYKEHSGATPYVLGLRQDGRCAWYRYERLSELRQSWFDICISA